MARLGVTSIFAASLHFHPIEHGYADERYFIELGPLSRYLLGLCFCEHCVAAVRERGARRAISMQSAYACIAHRG